MLHAEGQEHTYGLWSQIERTWLKYYVGSPAWKVSSGDITICHHHQTWNFFLPKRPARLCKIPWTHWKSVKKIPWYLIRTLDYELHLIKSSSLSLRGFCDIDWASNTDDRRSTLGSCVSLVPNLVSWWSKKQPLIARSSTEAEYHSLVDIVAEISWLQRLLQELHISSPKLTIVTI